MSKSVITPTPTPANIFIELNKINDLLIKEMPLELSNILTTKQYSYNYVYTLSKYREMFKKRVVESFLSNSANIPSNLEETVDKYLIYKIKRDLLPQIKIRCDEIAAIPIIEQKSPEWFKQREELISASDAGYFLKMCSHSKAIDTLKIKVGLKYYPNSTAKPLIHGNTYEDVARAIYESRHGVVVTEYGLLSARKPFIGASPDGIITDVKLATFDAISRFGRLLEIKNPYSREIDSKVKPEYMVQILQQQYTTILPVCDFVETTIVDIHCNCTNMEYKPYLSIDEMLADKIDITNPNHLKRIKNVNIPPQNLNKFGNEKGVVVCFSKKFNDTDIRNKYVLYPLDAVYESIVIEKWIVDLTSKLFTEGYSKTGIRLWRLDVYSEKTVVYNEKLYEEEYIPRLHDVWNTIVKCRDIIKNKGDVGSYIDDLENKKDSHFYNNSTRTKRTRNNAKNVKNDTTSTQNNIGCDTKHGTNDNLDHSDYSNGDTDTDDNNTHSGYDI